MREVVCLRVAWGKEYMGILHFLLSFALILKNTLKRKFVCLFFNGGKKASMESLD